MVDQNINILKANDERDKLIVRLKEIKDKFNDVVREKAELQQELISSEEEKLKVSKALIELQIENVNLQQQIQEQSFEINQKLMHTENELLEKNVNTEASSKAIKELQDQLAAALEDKQAVEMEFIALKKNFYNLRDDLDRERVRVESVHQEMENFVKDPNVKSAPQLQHQITPPRVDNRNEKKL